MDGTRSTYGSTCTNVTHLAFAIRYPEGLIGVTYFETAIRRMFGFCSKC